MSLGCRSLPSARARAWTPSQLTTAGRPLRAPGQDMVGLAIGAPPTRHGTPTRRWRWCRLELDDGRQTAVFAYLLWMGEDKATWPA
jgi:hypothetical protein